MKRKVGLTAAVLVGVVTLTACGSSGGSKSSGEADTTTTTKPSATSSTTAPGAKATLQLADTSLGKVVAGADGKVLYLYTPDGTAEVSTVPAGTLQAWPPVVVTTAPTVATGLDQSKVSVGTQANGQKWVRYNGHLLYGFTSGVWHAVNPSGDAIMS
jgi:predicted lipoprotein with Yx(FWY)xxD motif